MLIEAISGNCPVCDYNKMVQRFGTGNCSYFLDACPNCGFGYGSNSDVENWHQDAWRTYFRYLLAGHKAQKKMNALASDGVVEGDISLFDYYYDQSMNELNDLSDDQLRQQTFELIENTYDRSEDIVTTVWNYTEEDVNNFLETNPIIYKKHGK